MVTEYEHEENDPLNGCVGTVRQELHGSFVGVELDGDHYHNPDYLLSPDELRLLSSSPRLLEHDGRRVLDVLLSVLNEESYPLNQITRPHLEEIVEKIDGQIKTGWTGEAYTIWMDGVGP